MEKVYLNEMSLNGQFDDMDQFLDETMPLLRCLKYMSDQKIVVSKPSTLYDCKITQDKKLHDLRGVTNDKARRLKRLLLCVTDNPPFWDLDDVFKQDMGSRYILESTDVTATSIAEAAEDGKIKR